MRAWVLALLVVAAPARAEVSFGTVAAIDRVQLLPSASEATSIRIYGTFLSWSGAGYDQGSRGFVELACPVGRAAECRAQWSSVVVAAQDKMCVAFAWDAAPARVSPSTPGVWALARGVAVVQASAPLCERARATPTLTPPPLATAPTVSRPSPPAAALRWYGGWTLLADAASLATLPLVVGVGGYLVAAPTVHWSRGNVGRGFLSLGTRLAFPLIGLGVVCGVDGGNCSGDLGGLGVIFGVSGGALAAMLLDATVLAWDSGPAPRSRPIAWAPALAIDRSATVLGLNATF